MTSHLPEPHYRLRCTGCGRIHRDDDLSMPLSCDADHPPALLRSEYRRARAVADEPVVINLTGGGRARAARELPNVPTVPDLFAAPSDLQSIPERVARLAERRAA